MCGIVGYIGNKHPKDILLNGLKTLEYRGYDSSGIAIKNDKNIQIIKSVGKISNLEEKINNTKLIESNMGIGHTRWATHGEVNFVNAHPHQVGNITIVHNGIIENAKEIKDKLMNKGIKFKSNTDTEIACALINYNYNGDIIDAINKSINELIGSYAFAILVKDKNMLYAVRKDSPLLLGIGDNEFFIASDLSAIIKYTNKYILLDENEIVELSDTYRIIKNNKIVKKEILIADVNDELVSKCGYEHYMLKEIMEEPVVLENTLKPYLDNLNLLPDISKYKEIHIVGCGSALYAGMIGKNLLEEKANVKVLCEVASEYRYKNIIYDRKTLVILISQSGETADTIAALRKAKKYGIDTLSIVNVKTSTISRESDSRIFIEAGKEVAVATTKAYILQAAILSLIAYKTALKRKLISDKSILNEFRKLPKLLSEVINRDDYIRIAKEIYKSSNVFFIGRKIDYSICLEGSLKLKEISYIHCEAKEAGELKHGTISLIDNDIPVFGIITDKDIADKTISNIEEVKSRGAKVIVITNIELNKYDYEILVPKVNDFCQSLLVVPTLQLIAYEIAKLRGCDIDKPKNLAKSVTVE